MLTSEPFDQFRLDINQMTYWIDEMNPNEQSQQLIDKAKLY